MEAHDPPFPREFINHFLARNPKVVIFNPLLGSDYSAREIEKYKRHQPISGTLAPLKVVLSRVPYSSHLPRTNELKSYGPPIASGAPLTLTWQLRKFRFV